MMTDNPVHDAEMYESGQDEKTENLPVCGMCGFPIQDETCYVIQGTFFCNQCVKESKKYTEDLING
jgi:hypothetical protein